MQFNIGAEITVPAHRLDFKQRVKDRANQKFANIYGNREVAEDFIKAFDALVAGTAIPTAITTSWNQVKAIRAAQTTANQSITAATTSAQMHTAMQNFNAAMLNI